MTPLKHAFLTLIGLIGLLTAQAQDKKSFTYGEFKAGYGITQFDEGLDQPYEAGNFSTSGGGVATLAVYRKFSWGNYFNSGLKFKSLGAGPAQGDNGYEMFFNFWGAAITTKIFPFNKAAKQARLSCSIITSLASLPKSIGTNLSNNTIINLRSVMRLCSASVMTSC